MVIDCLFCKIIAGQIPATVVHRGERLTAIRDINPAAPTHILLLPNEHIGSVAEADPAIHAPARNPVAEARARLAAFARPGAAAAFASVEDGWEAF